MDLVTRCTMIHESRGRVYCRESIGQHHGGSPIAAEGEHFSLKFRGERNWATRARAVKATTPSEIPKTSARYIGFKVPRPRGSRLGVIERRLIKKKKKKKRRGTGRAKNVCSITRVLLPKAPVDRRRGENYAWKLGNL